METFENGDQSGDFENGELKNARFSRVNSKLDIPVRLKCIHV